MKTIKLWLTAIATLLCSLTANAHDFEVGGIYYKITSSADLTVEVTYRGSSYDGYDNEYSGAVTIPSTVTYNSKTYSVTSIGSSAFRYCSSLTSITIPESVTSIGYSAFEKCSSLTSITIPENSRLTSIRGFAFSYCSSLTSITIPESVTSIGDEAFYGCSSLLEVFILGDPSVNSSAFYNCHSNCEVYHPSDMITFESGTSEYGEPHKVSFTNKLKAYTATLKDYELESNAGTHTTNLVFSYSGGVEFDVKVPYTYTITKAPLTMNIGDATKTYGESNPTFTYEYSGFKRGDTEEVVSAMVITQATEKSGAGVYPITAEVTADNYEVTVNNGTLTVEKAPLSVKVKDVTKVYGDANPGFSVEYIGLKTWDNAPKLTKELTLQTIAGKGSDVGTYDIVASGGATDNYVFTEYLSGKLTITQAPLTVTANNFVRAYGDANPKFTVFYSGFKNDDTESALSKYPTVTTDAAVTSFVGEYALTPNAAVAKNYSFVYKNGTLKIEKAPLVIGVNDATRTYGDANPEYTYTYDGFKNNETSEMLSTKPKTNMVAVDANTGNHTLTPYGAEALNYAITYTNGTLTITKAPLTVIADDAQRIYGDANPQLTCRYDGFKNGETKAVLTTQPTVTTSAVAKSDVGTYEITVSGGQAKNYDFVSYQGAELTIKPAPLTLKVKDCTRLYYEDNPEYNYTLSGLKNNEDYSVLTTQPSFACEATKESNAGTYTITPNGADSKNYDITYQSGKLTVGKRKLTAKIKDVTRVYNEENPTFEVTYKGFVNSEDENVIAKMPTVACEAHKTSDVGVYNIGFTSEGEAANYSFVYESGVLTIEKATQEIIWEQEFSETIAIGTQIEINAEATSGLDLEFSIDNEKVAVIYQAAGKYYIDCCGAGVVNIKAIQAGNKNYHSAVRVSKLLTVFDPTGIEQLTIDNGQLTIYDLSGRKIEVEDLRELEKGVYIINGRKVLIND